MLGAVDEALRTPGLETSHALALVADGRLAGQAPLHGAAYPRSPLGRRLKDLARVIHAEVGLQLAATETGGWDTHIRQGWGKGPLAQRDEDLALSWAAFASLDAPRVRMAILARTMAPAGWRCSWEGASGADGYGGPGRASRSNTCSRGGMSPRSPTSASCWPRH
ncbi:uncharacterized protein STAUR_6737 [Stigmatella aurantiaca DW4/3-1]|uniref:Uncharacterized protein n=1 Tax=Stigmatella aurantiaca (strain DW4/3-1) TaxID=378806 RepID=E3FRA2_STIAD|nr:uncharacterized protein STAUR_6737 [Stigmatella aurantiaca DW4/3-1]